MQPLSALLANWYAREPAACLWLAVVALLLFGLTFVQSRDGDLRAWTWLRRLVESLARALVFVGLAAMLYFLLDSRSTAFNQIYASFTHGGSLSNQALNGWLDVYGGTFIQQDLSVIQYVTVEQVEEVQPSATPTPTRTAAPTVTATPTQPAELAFRPTLPTLAVLVEPGAATITITPTPTQVANQATPTAPSGPALYHTVITEQPLALNSITAFDGRVTLNLAHPEWQPDSFNSYALTALYQYQIANPSDQLTRAAFRFPLSADTRLYQDIHITRNGVEIPSWRIVDQAITWDYAMQPGQQDALSISYQTWGTNGFVFQIPEPREVTSFALTLALDSSFCCLTTEPEDGAIQLVDNTQPGSPFFTWKIDRAIIAPRLGVEYWQRWTYAPYYEMTVVPRYAPRAALFFLALAALTLLICKVPIRLAHMAILAGLFMLPFLIFMAGGFPMPDSIPPERFAGAQVKLLPVLTLLPLALAFWTLRRAQPRLPRLPQTLLLLLLALFMGGYTLIGLLPDSQKRNAVESAVQAAMIAYVFLLALFTRLRRPGGWRPKRANPLQPFLHALHVRMPVRRMHLPPMRLPRLPRFSAPMRWKYTHLALLGVVLLAVTLLGSLDGFPRFTRPHLPPPPGPRMTPVVTLPAPVRGAVPSIDGQVGRLYFSTWANNDWRYGPYFSKAKVDTVHWALFFQYPLLPAPVKLPLHFVCYQPDGQVLYEGTATHEISQDSTESQFMYDWGWEEPGHWQPGIYRLEVDSDGALLATGAFEITD